jgi:glycosyltransferase involved in cell wall biosynthesis
MADVTIIVVNYNTKKFIELCIKSIYKNTTPPFNLIIADNGSTDGSVEFMKPLAQSGKIHLVSRRTGQSASEHGKAIDHILYDSGLIKTQLICTIDSDAYAAKSGWNDELNKQRGDNFAVGYQHFRDQHYLHPACMLFEYSKILKMGRPSFALMKKDGKFYDTGIVVSQTALKRGEKLVGAKNIDKLVPHRWCATRILRVTGDEKLDNRITRSEFNAENNIWFSRPDVVDILTSKI